MFNFRSKLFTLFFIARRANFATLPQNRPIIDRITSSTFPFKLQICNASKIIRKTANFFDVLNAKDTNNIIIDVRKAKEIDENGYIPGSINIELDDLSNVLANMPDDDFKKKYGHAKPTHNTPIIFHCKSGKRSNLAQGVATVLGYKNARTYEGGFDDWKENIKKQK